MLNPALHSLHGLTIYPYTQKSIRPLQGSLHESLFYNFGRITLITTQSGSSQTTSGHVLHQIGIEFYKQTRYKVFNAAQYGGIHVT